MEETIKETTDEKFNRMRDAWRADWESMPKHLRTGNFSLRHPGYQEIISLGQGDQNRTLELIINDMRAGGRGWLPALRLITKIDPGRRKENEDLACRAWVEWFESL